MNDEAVNYIIRTSDATYKGMKSNERMLATHILAIFLNRFSRNSLDHYIRTIMEEVPEKSRLDKLTYKLIAFENISEYINLKINDQVVPVKPILKKYL